MLSCEISSADQQQQQGNTDERPITPSSSLDSNVYKSDREDSICEELDNDVDENQGNF